MAEASAPVPTKHSRTSVGVPSRMREQAPKHQRHGNCSTHTLSQIVNSETNVEPSSSTKTESRFDQVKTKRRSKTKSTFPSSPTQFKKQKPKHHLQQKTQHQKRNQNKRQASPIREVIDIEHKNRT